MRIPRTQGPEPDQSATGLHREAWSAASATFRPSSVVLCGAVLLAIAPAAHLAFPDLDTPLWTLWGLALTVTGVGLALCGLRPWLTGLAILVGALFTAQGICLGLILAGLDTVAIAYNALAAPKLASVALLGLASGAQLRRCRRAWLVAAGLAGCLKIGLREVLDWSGPWQDSVDLTVTVLLAASLAIMASGLRSHETSWARRKVAQSAARFEDFNRSPSDPPS